MRGSELLSESYTRYTPAFQLFNFYTWYSFTPGTVLHLKSFRTPNRFAPEIVSHLTKSFRTRQNHFAPEIVSHSTKSFRIRNRFAPGIVSHPHLYTRYTYSLILDTHTNIHLIVMSQSPTPGPSSAAAEVEKQISFELAAQVEVLPDKPTKYMTELIQQPRVRGVLLRHSKTLQFNRTTNRDAILAFTRGEVAEPACTTCEAGAGPFTQCVIISEMFKGSCTNCHYGSEGARCSFRPGKYLFFILD